MSMQLCARNSFARAALHRALSTSATSSQPRRQQPNRPAVTPQPHSHSTSIRKAELAQASATPAPASPLLSPVPSRLHPLSGLVSPAAAVVSSGSKRQAQALDSPRASPRKSSPSPTPAAPPSSSGLKTKKVAQPSPSLGGSPRSSIPPPPMAPPLPSILPRPAAQQQPASPRGSPRSASSASSPARLSPRPPNSTPSPASSSPSPRSSSSSSTGTSPSPVAPVTRRPLSVQTELLVREWSIEAVNAARRGDGQSMILVAQKLLQPGSWGVITHNREAGRKWLARARKDKSGEGWSVMALLLQHRYFPESLADDELEFIEKYYPRHNDDDDSDGDQF